MYPGVWFFILAHLSPVGVSIVHWLREAGVTRQMIKYPRCNVSFYNCKKPYHTTKCINMKPTKRLILADIHKKKNTDRCNHFLSIFLIGSTTEHGFPDLMYMPYSIIASAPTHLASDLLCLHGLFF